jgi:UDP-N-acetylglucosamine--N-acetylmuramyl-(pentapeptide) pyrophosphoryl-undecaprenol N-acetylglucosamine transferase
MQELLSKSHVVFSRAGASTLAELAAAGRPAFLIPYPYAAQNHQQENARAIASCEGGWVYDQNKITPSVVADFMRSCLHNPDQLLYAGNKIKTSSHFNASSLLYQFCTTP